MIGRSMILFSIGFARLPICPATEQNPHDYKIAISQYVYESQANKIANYWYEGTKDLDIVASFMCEAHFNDKAIGGKGERGLCQLLPNRTNNVWINDPRRSLPMYQAKICMEKWQAVPVKGNIRYCYAQREKYKKRILFLKPKKPCLQRGNDL